MLRIRLVAAVLAAAIAVLAAFTASAAVADDHDSGGTTTVVINPDVVPVLAALDVAPLKPGTLGASGGFVQASFPITGIEDGVVGHAGGLRFTPVGGGELKIRQFDVDLNTGFLTANTWLNGKRIKGRVPIFALGTPQTIAGEPACAGVPAGLTLTGAAADALGAPQYTGAFIGNACVLPD